MSSDWRDRLREVIKDDGRSVRAISLAAKGVGENYLQQMLKDEKDPGFTRLSSILTELGPAATLYVVSGLRPDPDQLRAALLAYGVHKDDLKQVMRAISGFVDDVDDAEQSPQDRSQAQTAPANRRLAKEPSE